MNDKQVHSDKHSLKDYVSIETMQVDKKIASLIDDTLLPRTALDRDRFWTEFSDLIHSLGPVNQKLLEKREELQAKIDDWHLQRKNTPIDAAEYKNFLEDIGYLLPQPDPFVIDTANVDAEIATIAGPQLVVPVMNARFALNACNARWGSLYDALYGTDVIPHEDGELQNGYNAKRGAKVIAYARDFLDNTFPLKKGSYHDAQSFLIESGDLKVVLKSGRTTSLSDASKLKGSRGEVNALYAGTKEPAGLLLENHGLHVDICLDSTGAIGSKDPAFIDDIVLESALTTIMDCEDSVAAVDAEDKCVVYQNWLGLMDGTLQEQVTKQGKTFTRKLNVDRFYTSSTGESIRLPGRSLLFVRNVGLLMTTPCVLDKNGDEIPEGILDAVITCLAAKEDLKRGEESDLPKNAIQNSKTGSIYIVKPKMHGPEEVSFSDTLFRRVEKLVGLKPNTVKMGIMDEERRTSVNLAACIQAANSRVAFINTGFLDRTGDEIHTSMEAGPFAPKGVIKTLPWIEAYEKSNVANGLNCGLHGKAQIGKGMWAMPDNMAAMMEAKVAQPLAGANTAWVPSPTAATLHAIHYHQVDVAEVQRTMIDHVQADVDTILQIPLLGGDAPLTSASIREEIENNAQGILGYVVRWINQGVGCSKVPDIHNIALMEDRATLRISSQHICNWLYHGICSRDQVMDILKAMAAVVDKQNAHDPSYIPMATDLDNSIAFKSAVDLIFKGREQPSGYTEPLLHANRVKYKRCGV